MQTFLPYPDFEQSAKALDYRRLGSQINECTQLLDALHETNNGGYRNHIVTRMWKFYEYQLACFGLICEKEWEARGYKERVNKAQLMQHLEYAVDGSHEYPFWFGDPEVHEKYKRLLIWKKPAFYQPKWPELTPLSGDDFTYPIL